MTFADLRISLKLGAAFGLLLAVFAVTGGLLLTNQNRVAQARAAAAASERVALDLSELKFSLTRQENSLRGFLISGDEYYVGLLMQTHKPKFGQHIGELREELAGDSAGLEQLSALQSSFDIWHKSAIEPAVALGRDPVTRPQAAAMVGQGGQTDGALERIVVQVAQIGQRVAEIALSAQEQATGLHQVNIAVNQMDQVTQQNAAMMEESTAASHALAHGSSELTRLIGQFRLSAEGRDLDRAA